MNFKEKTMVSSDVSQRAQHAENVWDVVLS
jgi:hypothetical protein